MEVIDDSKQTSLLLNSFDNQKSQMQSFSKMTYYVREDKKDFSEMFTPSSTRKSNEESPYKQTNKTKQPVNRQPIVKNYINA